MSGCFSTSGANFRSLDRGCSKIIAGLFKNWSILEDAKIPFVRQASSIHHRIAALVIYRW